MQHILYIIPLYANNNYRIQTQYTNNKFIQRAMKIFKIKGRNIPKLKIIK